MFEVLKYIPSQILNVRNVKYSCEKDKKYFIKVKKDVLALKMHLREGYINNDPLLKNQVDLINIFIFMGVWWWMVPRKFESWSCIAVKNAS